MRCSTRNCINNQPVVSVPRAPTPMEVFENIAINDAVFQAAMQQFLDNPNDNTAQVVVGVVATAFHSHNLFGGMKHETSPTPIRSSALNRQTIDWMHHAGGFSQFRD
jgi:hypothetical protein